MLFDNLWKFAKVLDESLLNCWCRRGAKECKSDRSRQELSNKYLLAKFGFDTVKNEPFSFHNFSSLQGFNFHRGVVSTKCRARCVGGGRRRRGGVGVAARRGPLARARNGFIHAFISGIISRQRFCFWKFQGRFLQDAVTACSEAVNDV